MKKIVKLKYQKKKKKKFLKLVKKSSINRAWRNDLPISFVDHTVAGKKKKTFRKLDHWHQIVAFI